CAEVLSPSTSSDDRTLKLPLYASTGVAHVWLIDPAGRTIEVCESIGGRPTLVATACDADVVRLPPFDAELTLASWWKPPPPSP
ncbi:MAG: Uma2 family endonuclease, partial [Polyangiaceae bacterium]